MAAIKNILMSIIFVPSATFYSYLRGLQYPGGLILYSGSLAYLDDIERKLFDYAISIHDIDTRQEEIKLEIHKILGNTIIGSRKRLTHNFSSRGIISNPSIKENNNSIFNNHETKHGRFFNFSRSYNVCMKKTFHFDVVN